MAEKLEEQKNRLAAHEAKKAIGQERRLAKADLHGYFRYGKVLQCGDHSCPISIMTTLRSTERAEAIAAQVAKKLGIDARDIFIRLNLEFVFSALGNCVRRRRAWSPGMPQWFVLSGLSNKVVKANMLALHSWVSH